MAKYIKSHSNYVIKTKHQQTDNGTIYERDITTIGGRDQFVPGQTPIYKSGNFVITVNNDINNYNKISSKEWKRNDEGEVWTLDNLANFEKDEKSSDDRKIVIKKDYYDLRDFAYYGSCSELIRTSINNIIKNYPGELFTPYEKIDNTYQGIKGYYTSMETASTLTYTDSCGEVVTAQNFSIIMSGDTLSDDEIDGIENGVPYTREIKYITNREGHNFDNPSNSGLTAATLYMVDNPFGINIHDSYLPDDKDPLRYFANGGYENYVAYIKDGVDSPWIIDDEHEYYIDGVSIVFDGISSISSTTTDHFNISYDGNENCRSGLFDVDIEAYSETNPISICPLLCSIPGKYIGKVKLTLRKGKYTFKTIPGLNANTNACDGCLEFSGNSESGLDIEGKYNGQDTKIESYETDENEKYLEILLFIGNDNEIKYFVEVKNGSYDNLLVRIRPKKDIIEDYFKNLDTFEKLLLNRDSDPLYTAIFELIGENDYGKYTYLKQFTFPTGYGGYNIGSSLQTFNPYVKELSDVGEFYDTIYTDNLWRSMTHEAIKNFDWTYTRHYTPGEEEPYIEGGTKIQKIIRLYGKEFDEVKTYIDAINDLNTVTYDNVNNLPDYFFSDKLEEYGWDVNLIQPLALYEYINGYMNVPVDIYSLFPNKYIPDGDGGFKSGCTSDAEKLNYFYTDESGKTKVTIQRIFNQEDISLTPYFCNNIDIKNGINGKILCGNRMKVYSDEKLFSPSDINNEFMKRLILNSNDILRHKGTIEGIEMLLGLFGLRSKNSVYKNEKYFVNIEDSSGSCLSLTNEGSKYYSGKTISELYDFDIKEYTLFTTKIEDTWLKDKNMYEFDWINSTKFASYANSNTYVTYQGLPVSFEEISKNEKRYLYPYFNSNGVYDGNPYYQMDGGWLRKKPFMFDNKNNIVSEEVADKYYDKLFTETTKNIKCVNTLDELLSNPSLANGNGDICEVINLTGRYAVIDGYLYPLINEYADDESQEVYSFFYATISNNSLSVGNAFFSDYVIISNPYSDNQKEKINLQDDYYNDREIKIYVLNTNGKYSIDVHSKDASISTFTVFENGKYMEGENYTHYFRINDVDYFNELSVLGWQQLRSDEYDYYKLDTITDYREGNNPHTGHMNYDNGHKYLTYFSKIFKTVIDEDLIDYREYDESDLRYLDDIQDLGFKNLIDEDECNTDYDKFLREDNKCHFFGAINSKEGRQKLSCFNKREPINNHGEEYNLTDIYRKSIVDDGDDTNIKIENLKYGSTYDSIGEYSWHYESGTVVSGYDENEITNVTDQIVNTKRLEIEFYIKDKNEYSKNWLEEVKYIDSVILPYLSQMIPSGTIWGVKYITKSKNEDVPCNGNAIISKCTEV